MALILILGLALLATAGVLALRALSLAQAGRRRTLDQIAVYGFRSAEPVVATPTDLRTVFGGIAATTGEKALGRFEGLRSGEGALRKLLTSAGMYQTSVASFVGARILATMVGPTIFVLCLLAGSVDMRVLLSCAVADGDGMVPSERRRAAPGSSSDRGDRPGSTGAGGLARHDRRGRRRLRRGAAAGLEKHRRPARPGTAPRAARAEPRADAGRGPPESRDPGGQPCDPACSRRRSLQGESLGVSIGTILRDLAIDMRKRRRQSAEERAQKTPTKILFPLIVLILPAMFIVVMGPAIMDIARFLTV